MEAQSKKHFNEIDIMRGIAIILVVIGHCSPYPQVEMNPTWFQILYKFIYLFHMPLFFFISGFCFYPSFQNAKTWKQKGEILLKKVMHLAVPYFFYSIVTLLLKAMFAQYANNPFAIKNFYRIFLGQNPNGGLWFLWILFVVTILILFINRLNLYVLLIIAVVLKIATGSWEIYNYLIEMVSGYAVFFVLGLILCKNYDKIHTNLINKASFILIMYSLTFFVSIWKNKPMFIILFGGLAGIIATWSMALRISRNSRIESILRGASSYSMDIYLLSYFVQVPIRIFANEIFVIPYILTFSAMLIMGIILPVLVSKYVIRRNKLLSFLLLGRYGR